MGVSGSLVLGQMKDKYKGFVVDERHILGSTKKVEDLSDRRWI